MEKLLKEIDLNFVFQYPVRCKYGFIADFYIPDKNLIIECDGEAWHNQKKDNRKTFSLLRLGYKVLRFKGKKIEIEPEKVKQEITNFMLSI